ncbi:Alpha/Beta hydrolase protein [Chytriomyces sp. MP71]|nr:Alpha/Beta hydrolase protein [Chytriomyces sp. MP71]
MEPVQDYARAVVQMVVFVLYAVWIAPMQSLLYVVFGVGGGGLPWLNGYRTHVGLFGDLIVRLVRYPTVSLGVPHDSPLLRSLLWLAAAFGNGVAARVAFCVARDSFADAHASVRTGFWLASQSASLAFVSESGSSPSGSEPSANKPVPNHRDQLAMLYVHGGGYVNGSPEISFLHSAHLCAAFDRIAKDHLSLIIFHPQYPLCPEFSNDDALQTCLDAYRFMLLKGFKRICLAGDSAGGHMALNLLAVLSTQHADLIQPVSAILYCPWVDPFLTVLPAQFGASDVSFHHDIITVVGSRYMASKFAPTITKEMRIAPLNWHDSVLESLTPNILIVYGGADVLRAGIDAFVDKLQRIADQKKTKQIIVKKRYPYMPHGFNRLFLDSFGVSRKTALESVDVSARFLFDSLSS